MGTSQEVYYQINGVEFHIVIGDSEVENVVTNGFESIANNLYAHIPGATFAGDEFSSNNLSGFLNIFTITDVISSTISDVYIYDIEDFRPEGLGDPDRTLTTDDIDDYYFEHSSDAEAIAALNYYLYHKLAGYSTHSNGSPNYLTEPCPYQKLDSCVLVVQST